MGGFALSGGSPQDRLVAALMLASVLGYSALPLFVVWGGIGSPFIFNAAFKIGAVAGCAAFLLTAYRPLLLSKAVWRLIGCRIVGLTTALWVCSYFSMAFYAWAAEFIDVSVSAVLYETWTILFIVLMGRLFSGERRYQRLSFRTLALCCAAFVGAACVIAAQIEGRGGLTDGSLLDLLAGVVIVIVSGGLTAMTAFGFRWGAGLASDLRNGGWDYERKGLELFGVIVGVGLCSLVAAPLTALVGIARGEPFSLELIASGLAGGVLIGAGSTIIWRKANIAARNLGVNALMYLAPVFALCWLFAFSYVAYVGDVNVVLLVVGACAIVAANAGVYFDRLM